jgi:hypothetical protein
VLITTVVLVSVTTPDGTVPDGSYQFQLTEELTDRDTGQVVSPRPTTPVLTGGQLIVALVANDSPGTTPTTTQYAVTEQVVGSPETSYFVTVPSAPPGSRQVATAEVVSGSAVVDAVGADFTTADVGSYVFCPGFAPGTTIASVTGPTAATLSRAATASGSGETLVIGASVLLTEIAPT